MAARLAAVVVEAAGSTRSQTDRAPTRRHPVVAAVGAGRTPEAGTSAAAAAEVEEHRTSAVAAAAG